MQRFKTWPDSRFDYPTAELMKNGYYNNMMDSDAGILSLMIREGGEIDAKKADWMRANRN